MPQGRVRHRERAKSGNRSRIPFSARDWRGRGRHVHGARSDRRGAFEDARAGYLRHHRHVPAGRAGAGQLAGDREDSERSRAEAPGARASRRSRTLRFRRNFDPPRGRDLSLRGCSPDSHTRPAVSPVLSPTTSPVSAGITGRPLVALRYAAGVGALALAYYLTGLFGLSMAFAERSVTLLWPPTGIALAVLFRAGTRYWLGVFAGALACNLMYSPVWAAVGIAAGNTLGVLVACAILQRLKFDRTFAHRRDLFAFLLACLIGMTITANNGTLWLAMSGGVVSDRLASAWLIWWLGDTAGAIVVAPLLLLAGRPQLSRVSWRPALALAATAALSWLAFTEVLAPTFRMVMVFPPFMMLIWVGLTERLEIASLHVVVLVVFALGCVTDSHPTFGSFSPATRILVLWSGAATASLVVLSLTTVQAQRERAEAALAATVAEFQTLVDGTPAAIVRYTADGILTFVNETLCRLLDCKRDWLIGRSVQDFIPNLPRSDGVADLPVAQPLSGPAAGASGLIRRGDGSCCWYRWTARRITGLDGRPEFQAVGIDLTERRQAEAERAALERKMQDAQRLEALGVLAGGVAHDFNNLLAGVLGHAELALVELPTNHPARDHLATVLSGVAQAGGLTRQLLAYSGKGRFLLRPLDLNDLIRQTTELLRLTLPKKVQLTLDLADSLPPVTADDGQLRQVLMNLLINAGEAIGDRAGTVTVSTAAHWLSLDTLSGGVDSRATPVQFIELIVSDTGC